MKENLSIFEILNLRSEYEQIVRNFSLPSRESDIDSIRWFLEHGRKSNSLRNDYEVSSPALDQLVGSLRDAGALGARLTGAGFGGCVLALCETASVDTIISRAVETNPDSYLIDLICS